MELEANARSLGVLTGGMTFGYDLGALSCATQGLKHSYTLSPNLFGLTVSISLWGAVSSLIAGHLADTLGRRGLLVLCAALYALSAGVLAQTVLCPWSMILALRLLAGMSIGGFVVCCPLYLAEIAPQALRGRFVGWFQVQIGTGVVLAFGTSAILAHYNTEAGTWKWGLGLGDLPPVFMLAALHWLPEEPHWLAARGRWREAGAVADRLGLSSEEWPRGAGSSTISLPSPSSQEALFQRKYLRPLLLATSVALFNQLCGVNVLLVYLLGVASK